MLLDTAPRLYQYSVKVFFLQCEREERVMADNEKIIKVLFSELEKPLFLGDKLTSGQFGTLMQPGQFVSTNLQEQDSSEDMAIEYELTNDLLDTSFIYKPLVGGIGQVLRYTNSKSPAI
jgi:hypothetical protein